MGNFERIRYPDGQIGAKYIGGSQVDMGKDPKPKRFTIEERINNYEDLFYIRSIAEVLTFTGVGTHMYKLFIPCLFGQRSDRRFSDTQSFDLKLITNIINDCNFNSVEILDPHSDVALALINKSRKVSSFEYVQKACVDIVEKEGEQIDLLLVSPDAGAYKKVFEFGEKLGYPVMGAMKHRDKDGTISLMFTHDVEGMDCLIVDDLCDGGYTFLLLAKELRKMKARKVYLYVTHGLFSKGFDELEKVIDHIYCTNSVKDIDIGQLYFQDALATPAQKLTEMIKTIRQKDYVTQYKII